MRKEGMRKLIAATACAAALSVAAVSGTMAYLQDADSDVNVMTLGNVDIVQHEYQRATNEDGIYKTNTIDGQTSYVLEAFEQGKPLYPIVGDPNEPGNSPAYAGYDDTIVRMTQVDSYGSMQVFAGKNAQDKFVTVENTGKSEAYVRTLVAIEAGSTDGSLIGKSNRAQKADEAGTQPWIVSSVGQISIDGNNYNVYEYVYRGASDVNRHVNGVLPAGDTTYPSLCQVYLKHNATNKDVEAIDGNGNGTLDILVLSQAVQTNGFADAQTALDTAFGKASEKAAEWFGGMGNAQFVEAGGEKAQLTGEKAAEILSTLENGQNLIVDEDVDIIAFDTNALDAKGATVTLAGVGPEAYGYLAFVPGAGEPVTVSNLNVTGSGFVEFGDWNQGGGTYVANNLKITDFASTLANGDKGFTLACAFCGYGNTTLNDCVMVGATAVQEGAIPVDLGCVNDTTTAVNGGEYGTVYCWSHSFVTVNDADVDTLYASPIKGTVTVKAGSHIDTIKVEYGTSDANVTKARLQKLVIEDGAEVGSVVFRGVSYTVEQWNAFVASFQ